MGNSWLRRDASNGNVSASGCGKSIPPSNLFAGVAQRQEHSVVSREGAGSSPVVRASWWLWCNGSIRGCEPRGTGSNPVGQPCCCADEGTCVVAVV